MYVAETVHKFSYCHGCHLVIDGKVVGIQECSKLKLLSRTCMLNKSTCQCKQDKKRIPTRFIEEVATWKRLVCRDKLWCKENCPYKIIIDINTSNLK